MCFFEVLFPNQILLKDHVLFKHKNSSTLVKIKVVSFEKVKQIFGFIFHFFGKST